MLISENLFLEWKTCQKTCSVSLWTPRLQSWSSEAGLRVQRAARDCVDFRFIRQYKKIFTVYWSLNLQCFTSLLLSVLFLIPRISEGKKICLSLKKDVVLLFLERKYQKTCQGALSLWTSRVFILVCWGRVAGSTRFQPETAQTSNSRILYRSLTHG